MKVDFKVARLLVKSILQSPFGLEWSTQGLGMLRTYLSQEVRLHIWDSSLRVPDVSPIHDHPWHLDSLIVSGVLHNQRFEPVERVFLGAETSTEILNRAQILCGEKACTVSETDRLLMLRRGLETYHSGQMYHQEKDEVHETLPEDGTVTLVGRTFTPDRDHASVYWRGNGPWVDARPRTATVEEIASVTQAAFGRMREEGA